jgi:hypothetical protein
MVVTGFFYLCIAASVAALIVSEWPCHYVTFAGANGADQSSSPRGCSVLIMIFLLY